MNHALESTRSHYSDYSHFSTPNVAAEDGKVMKEAAKAPDHTEEHYATWALLGILASQVDWTVYQAQRLQLHQSTDELRQIAERLRGYAWALTRGTGAQERGTDADTT